MASCPPPPLPWVSPSGASPRRSVRESEESPKSTHLAGQGVGGGWWWWCVCGVCGCGCVGGGGQGHGTAELNAVSPQCPLGVVLTCSAQPRPSHAPRCHALVPADVDGLGGQGGNAGVGGWIGVWVCRWGVWVGCNGCSASAAVDAWAAAKRLQCSPVPKPKHGLAAQQPPPPHVAWSPLLRLTSAASLRSSELNSSPPILSCVFVFFFGGGAGQNIVEGKTWFTEILCQVCLCCECVLCVCVGGWGGGGRTQRKPCMLPAAPAPPRALPLPMPFTPRLAALLRSDQAAQRIIELRRQALALVLPAGAGGQRGRGRAGLRAGFWGRASARLSGVCHARGGL